MADWSQTLPIGTTVSLKMRGRRRNFASGDRVCSATPDPLIDSGSASLESK